MALRPDFYTVETIAAQVAKSPAYVRGRISLTELIPAAQTGFYDGKLTVAHAIEIARLQTHDQERALMECFPGHRSTGSILKDRKAEALTVRQLREWIERELHLDLKHAPFNTEDASLLPAAGACSTYPNQSQLPQSFQPRGDPLGTRHAKGGIGASAKRPKPDSSKTCSARCQASFHSDVSSGAENVT